jgi:hypothetical protein
MSKKTHINTSPEKERYFLIINALHLAARRAALLIHMPGHSVFPDLPDIQHIVAMTGELNSYSGLILRYIEAPDEHLPSKQTPN